MFYFIVKLHVLILKTASQYGVTLTSVIAYRLDRQLHIHTRE